MHKIIELHQMAIVESLQSGVLNQLQKPDMILYASLCIPLHQYMSHEVLIKTRPTFFTLWKNMCLCVTHTDSHQGTWATLARNHASGSKPCGGLARSSGASEWSILHLPTSRVRTGPGAPGVCGVVRLRQKTHTHTMSLLVHGMVSVNSKQVTLLQSTTKPETWQWLQATLY